jgi:hypothetical protein
MKNEKQQIENEFWRIAEMLIQGNSLDCLLDLIPYKKKKDFVEDWKRQDEEADEEK